MFRKNKDFLQQEKESEQFLKKVTSNQLQKVTVQRKKDSSLNYHKFELIKYFQEMGEHQKKLEEELKLFNEEKATKDIKEEELNLFVDRSDYRKGVYTQIDGFAALVNDLKKQLDLFKQLANEGKKTEGKIE